LEGKTKSFFFIDPMEIENGEGETIKIDKDKGPIDYSQKIEESRRRI
jgi:hypothetical protein